MSFENEFPLHYSIWNNDISNLERLLAAAPTEASLRTADLEKVDPRGRTPLLLAVTMDRVECVKLLLKAGADATAENKQFWSVVDEAVTSGDPELVTLCVRYRDAQRFNRRRRAVGELLSKLWQTRDFYVEMKWEFTSWIPFVSKVCPSDSYKVYKRGRDVRIDTTLLGFDDGEWKRGRQTFIFKAKEPNGAEFLIVDHETQIVFVEDIPDIGQIGVGVDENVESFVPNEESIVNRLTAPVAVTYVDVDQISFERKQSGLFGFKSEKTETLNGYQCKVYTATNVELITKIRTEHLMDEDKQALESQQRRNMLDSLMNWFQGSEVKTNIGGGDISPNEYFNNSISLNNFDVGRPKEITAKSRKFNATLWLGENFPLSLPEQVLPIVDLMAATNAHFARLRNFITLQLPSGFPIKIEIPLFHLITASVTFENVFAENASVPHVSPMVEGEETTGCVIDDCIFDIPQGYATRDMGSQQHNWTENEEDALMQYAIQQSISGGGGGNQHARRLINNDRDLFFGDEDLALQRAIDESLRCSSLGGSGGDETAANVVAVDTLEPVELSAAAPVVFDDLSVALAESLREEEERRRRIEMEEKELAEILKLSMNDK